MSKREFRIFSGSSNIKLAEKITKNLKTNLGEIDLKRFSDGEIWVKYKENIRGLDVFIVQSTIPPAENLMELLIMIDAAKRASARRITAVIPYFGYARQDRKDQPRVSISAKLVANLITVAGADRVITMDLHAAQIQGFFDIPFDHLYASPIFTGLFRNKHENLVVVSPDIGGIKLARSYARRLHANLVVIDKRRPKPNQAEVMNVIGEVANKDVLIVDDIIDTGGTFVSAIKALKNKNAHRIYGAVTHPVFSDDAYNKIENSALEKLFISDTLYFDENKRTKKIFIRTASKIFSEAIMRTHKHESISSLFEIDKG
jgi:ribose-phosphate pyrophosphokinase